VILESAFSHEPHEYLRDTLDSKYRECNSSFNRTEFTCVKCGFCWSCLRKIEQAEKFELFDRSIGIDILASSFSSYSRLMTVKEKGKEKKALACALSKEISNYQITTKVIDVFGKEVEPICDYLRCHHKLSVHGLSSSKCRCKHPQNNAIGA
jgi:hypothetical protein